MLVDGRGIPLSLSVSGANTNDGTLLEPTLKARVTLPARGTVTCMHLCADMAYGGRPQLEIIYAYGYLPHVHPWKKGPRASRPPHHKRGRRWVVERTHSWLNRFRKILVRFEKTLAAHEGLLELACALIVFRQVITIYG